MADDTRSPDLLTPLEAAIAVAGGAVEIARALNISRGAPHQWRRSGSLPLARVGAVSRLTGIPPHVLRPDHFDAPAHMRKGVTA